MNSKKLLDKVYEYDIHAYIGLDYSDLGYWEADNVRDFKQAQECFLSRLSEHMNLKPEHTVLDIGGGQGGAAIWLHKKYGCKVVVVDLVEAMIDAGVAKVRAQHLEHAISFHCVDVLDFNTEQQFDAILSVGVLHHIKNTSALLKKCFALLRPGGQLSASFYVANFKPRWLLNQYLLLTVGDKNLPPSQNYKHAAKSAFFQDVKLTDVSEHVLPKSSRLLQEEPYWSKIKAYHKKYYGSISVWLMPLFLKLHNRVIRNEQLQAYFLQCTKPGASS